MSARSLTFRWIPFDDERIFDQPGRFGIVYDGSPASAQMSVLINKDLAKTNGELDPEDLLGLADRIESVQAGDPWPANIMDGVDGFVNFSEGVVLVASSTTEDSALLIAPDEFKRVLRSVHAVLAGPNLRNPDAVLDAITFDVIAEGEDAVTEYFRRGGANSHWEFDPKKCTFTYEGQPDDFVYPNPIPEGYKELCE